LTKKTIIFHRIYLNFNFEFEFLKWDVIWVHGFVVLFGWS
jgi:hypothetical protein